MRFTIESHNFLNGNQERNSEIIKAITDSNKLLEWSRGKREKDGGREIIEEREEG